jgi:PHD/YefM family antitoxin component YafN of YafNO toxin-antitoxin module
MTLTRQQKRQIERKARAYMAAVDADLVTKLNRERKGTVPHSYYSAMFMREAVNEIVATLPK